MNDYVSNVDKKIIKSNTTLSDRDYLALLQGKVGNLHSELHAIGKRLEKINDCFKWILMLNFLILAGICSQLYLGFQ